MSLTEPETAAQIEASEALADQIEQAWLSDQDAADMADLWGDDAPDIGRTAQSQAGWEPGGDREAEWAIDMVLRGETERDRIRANAQAAIERIQAKALRDEARSVRTVEFFTSKLIGYRRRMEAENPKLDKTFHLANGDLCVRAGRKSVQVDDESAYIDWAIESAPQAVTYKPKVSGLKDLPRQDGQIIDPSSGEPVPGVREVVGSPTYSVKPSATTEEPF